MEHVDYTKKIIDMIVDWAGKQNLDYCKRCGGKPDIFGGVDIHCHSLIITILCKNCRAQDSVEIQHNEVGYLTSKQKMKNLIREWNEWVVNLH